MGSATAHAVPPVRAPVLGNTLAACRPRLLLRIICFAVLFFAGTMRSVGAATPSTAPMRTARRSCGSARGSELTVDQLAAWLAGWRAGWLIMCGLASVMSGLRAVWHSTPWVVSRVLIFLFET